MNSLAPVCNDKGMWGYINKNGSEVIPYKYGYADSFMEGTARVMKNGKWLEIDLDGKEL